MTDDLILITESGVKLEPLDMLEGHYAAYDKIGCQYWVHGGGTYWQVQYAKTGVIHLSIGEYIACPDPESALDFFDKARKGFIQWLFTIESVRLQEVNGNLISLKIVDIPPFKAVVDVPSHIRDIEAAYAAMVSANKNGSHIDEISLFWDHYVNTVVGED